MFLLLSILISLAEAQTKIRVNLLPPIPKSTVPQIGVFEVSVFERVDDDWTPLVEKTTSPLGDCKECKRGVSLNCLGLPQCKKGPLKGGIGIRLAGEKVDQMHLEIKNSSEFTPGFSKQITFNEKKLFNATTPPTPTYKIRLLCK